MLRSLDAQPCMVYQGRPNCPLPNTTIQDSGVKIGMNLSRAENNRQTSAGGLQYMRIDLHEEVCQ